MSKPLTASAVPNLPAVPPLPDVPHVPATPVTRSPGARAARFTSFGGRAAAAALAALVALASAAAEARSPAARAEFQQQQPCPVNGRKRGACPGFQVDHRVPLKCGGADAPHNMQWLTVAQHKAKTAREAKACRKRRSR